MIPDKSVHLIVTSPPYPMVEMWDGMFKDQNPFISKLFEKKEYNKAFLEMHKVLDNVWKECDRVLIDGGFACINIGDATRTFDDKFQLFSNHTHIINAFSKMGYSVLPDIHWRKQTNAPNKFMGSGMYPAGAYVTYEHEYILIFRKGGKRQFSNEEKKTRQQSAYFWEERNEWFSDLWDIKGAKQTIKTNIDRTRNASYPFDIPYRLINMYSIYGDTVLDPFAGLGTTTLSAITTGRNSISVEISKDIINLAKDRVLGNNIIYQINNIIDIRLNKHKDFIKCLSEDKMEKCYENEPHNFLVKTKQETKMKIYEITNIEKQNKNIKCILTKKD
jgi:DNA modification methylase